MRLGHVAASLLVVALLVLAAGGSMPANADVLCKSRNSVVKVRAKCKPSETQLDIAALGLQGPPGVKGDKGDPGQPGAPGATGPQGPIGPSLVVKDANGALVGTILQSPSRVVRQVGPFPIGLAVAATTIYAPANPSPWYYVSGDCSGEPLMPAPEGAWGLTLPVDAIPGRGFNAAYPTAFGTMMTAHSFEPDPTTPRASQADCSGGATFIPPDRCCQEQANTVNDFAPLAVIDSQGAALGLVPPFHTEGP